MVIGNILGWGSYIEHRHIKGDEVNEQNLKLRVLDYIKKNYPLALVWKMADKFASGRPDLLLIFPKEYCINPESQALHLFIELKRKNGKLTPLQSHTIWMINAIDGNAYCADSLERVVQILDKYLKKSEGR